MKQSFVSPSLLTKYLSIILLFGVFAVSCAKEPSLPTELILYNWIDYMPQSVLDAFTSEYGMTVRYVPYESQEAAKASIEAGEVYDLVLLGAEFIPPLAEEGLLRPIDYRNVPNFKYVLPSFRDLAFDPSNTYSVPFHWGTTGLLVRTDRVDRPISSWNDLWDPTLAGKVGVWPIPRSLIPITLKALGYSANSEDPAELEQARQKLLALKSNAIVMSNMDSSVVPVLESDEVQVAYGWAYDAILAQQSNVPIEYVIPQEGTILWTDHFLIPANARNPRGAELFLNFILQPKIAAQIVEESYYAMAVDGTEQFIAPEILNEPIIFPDQAQLQKAEVTLPIHKERRWLYDDIWASFIEDHP